MDYLTYEFMDSEEFVSAYDEVCLWSAAFGQLFFKNFALRKGITLVDLGCGTGFPLIELAQRLGASSRCIGVDPWIYASSRALEKCKVYGVTNVEYIVASASQLSFENESIDCIVSNLGINNFDNPSQIFRECFRVLKPSGTLSLTSNLNGHWIEFYNVFRATAVDLGMMDVDQLIVDQQAKRGTEESVRALFETSGFTVTKCDRDTLEMKYLDASAFLNHSFVKLGWIKPFRNLVPETRRVEFFTLLENKLNDIATRDGCLAFTVPMIYLEGEKR